MVAPDIVGPLSMGSNWIIPSSIVLPLRVMVPEIGYRLGPVSPQPTSTTATMTKDVRSIGRLSRCTLQHVCMTDYRLDTCRAANRGAVSICGHENTMHLMTMP